MLVNGDLLFHEGLWSHFQGPNPNATDGTAFNFDPLFAPMKQYIQASDIAVCEFETPYRPARRPICRVPDLQHSAGSGGCRPQRGIQRLHTRHQPFLDQGADGIARLWDTLEADGIAQTGSYKTEADSTKPLVIDLPTGGGKLGLVTGTVSLNGMTADEDWAGGSSARRRRPESRQRHPARGRQGQQGPRARCRCGGHRHGLGAGIP